MILFDLVGRGRAHFSPNSWRVRMALAHKGLAYETREVLFTQIAQIAAGQALTIPTLQLDDRFIPDSWVIVRTLDERFARTPTMIGDGTQAHVMRFFQSWVQTAVHAGIAQLILKDVHDLLEPADQAYFRATREKMFGKPLEQLQSGRESRLEAFRHGLQPLRLAVQAQPFVGGDAPCYADYLAFGGFQWARVSSRFELLAEDDKVMRDWRDRMFSLHDGLLRKSPN